VRIGAPPPFSLHSALRALIIQSMRRLTIIFLLFILPLQASWGAVIAYSAHELAEITATSFVDSDNADEQQLAGNPPANKDHSGFDEDCAVCHLAHHSNIILPPFAVAAPMLTLLLFESSSRGDTLIASFPASRPERPKWAAAV
jgi:hypothetical protein